MLVVLFFRKNWLLLVSGVIGCARSACHPFRSNWAYMDMTAIFFSLPRRRTVIRSLFFVFAASAIGTLNATDVTTLPDATAGQTYSFKVKIKGGKAPYTYSSTGMPDGLSIDPRSGVISGSPVTGQGNPFLFSVRVEDNDRSFNSFIFALSVKSPAIQLDDSGTPETSTLVLANHPSVSPSNSEPNGGTDKPAVSNLPAQTMSTASSTGTFSLKSDAQSKTVANSPVSFTITITPGNCSGGIALSTSGLPTGVTGTFNPQTISGSNTSSTLTLTYGPSLSQTSNFDVVGSCGNVTQTIPLTLIAPLGTLTRAIVGLEGSGASSSSSTAKLFFDIFHSHPLGKAGDNSGPFGAQNRLWGLVRIGTTPIQTTAAISSITSDLTSQAKKLTLNQLAQSGEFQLGYEFQALRGRGGPFGSLIHDKESTSFGWIVGGGTTLPFDPKSQVLAFDLPASGPGRQRFNSQYPAYVSLTDTQVAFATPDRNQFFRQYFGGFRLTTLFEETDSDKAIYHPVGTLTFTIGQNEAVSGGHLRGLVGQVEGFYPIPIDIGNKSLSGFYVFGRAAFQLTSAAQNTPLLLNQSATQPTEFSSITVISRASRRDLWAFGIGIDAFRFAKNLFGAATAKSVSP
jgi:hypothetical protein